MKVTEVTEGMRFVDKASGNVYRFIGISVLKRSNIETEAIIVFRQVRRRADILGLILDAALGTKTYIQSELMDVFVSKINTGSITFL